MCRKTFPCMQIRRTVHFREVCLHQDGVWCISTTSQSGSHFPNVMFSTDGQPKWNYTLAQACVLGLWDQTGGFVHNSSMHVENMQTGVELVSVRPSHHCTTLSFYKDFKKHSHNQHDAQIIIITAWIRRLTPNFRIMSTKETAQKPDPPIKSVSALMPAGWIVTRYPCELLHIRLLLAWIVIKSPG